MPKAGEFYRIVNANEYSISRIDKAFKKSVFYTVIEVSSESNSVPYSVKLGDQNIAQPGMFSKAAGASKIIGAELTALQLKYS